MENRGKLEREVGLNKIGGKIEVEFAWSCTVWDLGCWVVERFKNVTPVAADTRSSVVVREGSQITDLADREIDF